VVCSHVNVEFPTSTTPSLPPCICCFFQGGLRLSSVLSILVQAAAGLLHLHDLGILHRDLRAANLLLDALDPLHVRLADFGVSHRLSAFEGPRHADLSAGKVPTLLWGTAALGPMQVCVEIRPDSACLLVCHISGLRST
jgi:serine/threonine protein kinase